MKKSIFSLAIIVILTMLSGCGSSSYNEYYSNQYKKNQLNKNIEKVIDNKFAHLSVKTTPKADRIYILNIKPRYKDGIKLKKGKYHIKIVKNGYQIYKKWINLDKDTTLNITLKKRQDIYIPSKKDYFKYVTNIKWDFHNNMFIEFLNTKLHNIWAIQYNYFIKAKTLKKPIEYKDRYGHYIIPTITYYTDGILELINTNGKSYRYGNMNNLMVNGVKHKYRFPKITEFRKYGIYKNIPKKFGYISGYTSCWYSFETPLNNGWCFQFYNEDSPHCDKPNLSYWRYHYLHSEGNIPIYLVRKFDNKYDKIIFSSLSPIQKLAKVTNILVQDRLKVKKEKITKPKAPKKVYPKKLKKGEFEKTIDYQKRVKKEKQRVDRINKDNELKYQQQLINYKKALKKADEKYKKQIENNKKEAIIRKIANEEVNHAITMVFGDPKFKNLKYDADKEQFNAILYSTLNNFSMKVSIPMPLSKAKEFKAKLTNNLLVPSVKLKVKNGKLLFDSVSVVANKIKQKQDFIIAKNKNTIQAYEEFLSYHPNAPQASQAKKLLKKVKTKNAYNNARGSIYRLEKFIKTYHNSKYIPKAKKELKELKEKQRIREERQKRERDSYYAKKHIGQKVCKKGSIVFGFMDVKITAYVENIKGDDIQLRISSTENQNINYQGGRLYVGKVIWDKYYNWGSCEY